MPKSEPQQVKFNKTAIAALPLPPPGKRAAYYHPKIKGLMVRVTSGGAKTFYVLRWVRNRPEWSALGKFPTMTPEQAERAAEAFNGALASGNNPNEAKRKLRGESTFDDLFRLYMERHSKPRKRTWQEDIDKYHRHLEKPLSKKRLSQISRADIAAIHDKLTREGKATTANRILALLSSVFGRAMEWGLMENNPAKGIRRNQETSRDRFLQSDELPRFFQALSEETSDTVRDYFLISLLTGARRSNVLAMRWSEISFERAEWRIPNTKNGTPQTVTLSQDVVTILKMRLEKSASDYVFPSTGQTGHLVEPKKGWERILKRADLENLRIHDLRRTFGSWQAKTGASLPIIGKSLNHKSPITTSIYARLDLDPVRESVEKATFAMLAAAGISKGDNINPPLSDGAPNRTERKE